MCISISCFGGGLFFLWPFQRWASDLQNFPGVTLFAIRNSSPFWQVGKCHFLQFFQVDVPLLSSWFFENQQQTDACHNCEITCEACPKGRSHVIDLLSRFWGCGCLNSCWEINGANDWTQPDWCNEVVTPSFRSELQGTHGNFGRSGSWYVSSWWQLIFFLFSPLYLGKIPILTSIFFQRGWFNHQPGLIGVFPMDLLGTNRTCFFFVFHGSVVRWSIPFAAASTDRGKAPTFGE